MQALQKAGCQLRPQRHVRHKATVPSFRSEARQVRFTSLKPPPSPGGGSPRTLTLVIHLFLEKDIWA